MSEYHYCLCRRGASVLMGLWRVRLHVRRASRGIRVRQLANLNLRITPD